MIILYLLFSSFFRLPLSASSSSFSSPPGKPAKDWFGRDASVEARNCYVWAPSQWANQGCVATSERDGTLGAPVNAAGGGLYVLEWDPSPAPLPARYVGPAGRGRMPGGFIRAWAFVPRGNACSVRPPSVAFLSLSFNFVVVW
jgi:hypothetical protein